MDYAGFIGPSYTVQSVPADNQRGVNLYVQQDESGFGKSKAILLSTPGLLKLVDFRGAGAIRGTYTASNDRFFAVAGSTLYEIGSTWNILGSYALPGETGSGPVSMTDNGQDMMIATGPNGYWFHFEDNGSLSNISINVPGTGWAIGDTFAIAGGTAIGMVTAETGGIPSAVALVSPGTGYITGVAATNAQLPSVGVGLTLGITVLPANTLTQITDAVFQGAVTCAFIDGYIVFNQPNTQIFWITDLYSTVINPLGFASAEGNPDNLLSLLVDHREIWLFGDVSTEVWYDSGNANFPFSFIQGAFISHGIVAPFSAVRLDNTTFWLGNDEFGQGIVWRANGYAPVRISNYAMEQAIQKYSTITDAVAWTYQQDGHSFYVLNFPSGDATWVYDAATGLWHERAYLGTLTFNDGALHRGRPQTHSFAFGKHIVGDWQEDYLYEMSPKYLDDNGREIQRMRRAPFIDNEKKRIFLSKFELDMEVTPGNSLTAGANGADSSATTSTSTTVYDNASGQASFYVSAPLGQNFYGVKWNTFSVPDALPSDAVIVGIYPVIVCNAAYTAAVQWVKYGASLNLHIPINGTSMQHPFGSSQGAPQANFPTTTLWGDSIGTDLSDLTGEEIAMFLNSSISIPAITPPDQMNAIGVGFAIYYTSATPILDPQLPAPFPVPPGQGIGWALPFGTDQTGLENPDTGYLGITQTSLLGGVATYTFVLQQGSGPIPGSGIQIHNTTNAGGALNGNFGVATVVGSTFTVNGFSHADAPAQAEDGDGAIDSQGYSKVAPATSTVIAVAWSNPLNILYNNGSFTSNPFISSAVLSVTDFGFNVAGTVEPTGIQINLGGYASAPVTLTLQLLSSGSPIGSPKTIIMPTILGIFSLGSLTDLWGAALTNAIINDPSFGVQITATGAGTTYLTSISMTVGVEFITDPLINLRWSDDGGYTWSPYNAISMGGVGQYRKRVIWRRLGHTRQRIFEVSTGQNYIGLSMYAAYLELIGANI